VRYDHLYWSLGVKGLKRLGKESKRRFRADMEEPVNSVQNGISSPTNYQIR